MRLAFIPAFKRLACGTCLAAFVGLSGLAGGCGEVVTYANQSRQQGIRLYNEGQYPEAVGSFNSAIKQRPQDYESYYYLGRTYEAMDSHHQAVSEYRTALSLMDKSLRGEKDAAFRQKVVDALASAIAGGNDAALEQAAFRKTGGPKTAEDFFVLAKVRRIHGDVDSALAEYARAASLAPKSFPIAKEYGLYLLQLNQRDAATAQLRRAYAINYRARNPDDEQVNQGLRSAGVVPGPSLASQDDLAKPLIPTGPLPEIDLTEKPANSPR